MRLELSPFAATHISHRCVAYNHRSCHWLNPSLLDGEFDPSKPEILLYLPDGDGWRLVGVEYVVPLTLSPGVAPQGFPGDADTWREDSEGVGLWELTAWIWLNNPNGMFEQHNPRAE